MKPSMIKKLVCVTAVSLAPFLVFAGGTNGGVDPSTGYKSDPADRSLEQGDMGAKGVGQPSGSSEQDKVDDSTLSKQIDEALKSDAMLRKLDIKAEVKDGVVTLTGDAKDLRWQARATQVANSVKGVKSVQNNLTVGKEKK